MLPALPSSPLCRAVTRFTSPALLPEPPGAEASGARPREGKGTHLARQTAVSTCPRLPATPLRPLAPGRTTLQLPLSTSRHDLKPELTGMNVWLPPLPPAPPAWARHSPADAILPPEHLGARTSSPPGSQVPASPAQASPSAPLRSCQTPDSKVILGPRTRPCTPLPHASLVTPRTQ